jgi:hypothetical protein
MSRTHYLDSEILLIGPRIFVAEAPQPLFHAPCSFHSSLHMGCRTALKQPYAGLLSDEIHDLEVGRRQGRLQFVELGNEGP